MSEFRQFTEVRPITLEEFLQHPPAPQGYILEPWLRERHAAMLFAPTGAGKSQVAMSMALAVASGGGKINVGSGEVTIPVTVTGK